MRMIFPLLAVLLAGACKKEPKAETPPVRQEESVPVSNDPRQGAAMIGAAQRVAGQASEAGAARETEAEKGP